MISLSKLYNEMVTNLWISSSISVPLRAASSRSCILRSSFDPSGVSTPSLIILSILWNKQKQKYKSCFLKNEVE